jgi:PEP-CTERM motif
VTPVGDENPYYTFEAAFTPTTTSAGITISNADIGPDGTSVLLLDDVAVLATVPEPSTIALLSVAGSLFLYRRRRHNITN